MSWARVDDGWWCHPKVMGLDLAARGLWVSALSWSCAQRRDVVPETFLLMVGAKQDEANALASAGLWVATDDGWRIHDWAVYQELSTSEKRAEAGRKGGKRSGEVRRSAKQTEASDEAGTQPHPSRPVPTTTTEHDDSSDAPADPERPVVVDQPTTVRAIRLVADVQAASGAAPSALAATIRRRMADPEDPDRQRIDSELAAGRPPEDIAAGWHTAPAGYPVDQAAQERPRLNEVVPSKTTPPPKAVGLAGSAAARAALRRRSEVVPS